PIYTKPPPLRGDPESDRRVDGFADDVGEDERVRPHGGGGDGLLAELLESTAVEQPVHTTGDGGGGEKADEQGSGEAADEVHRDDIEGVVEAEAVLQRHGKRAECTGDDAHGE